jgi:hypothetical protein
MTSSLEFDDGAVVCARCGDSNGLHLQAVRVNELGDVTAITPARIERYATSKDSDHARGSIVEIDFWCEFCQHPFQARFRFHKGQVLHEVRALPTLPGGYDAELTRD